MKKMILVFLILIYPIYYYLATGVVSNLLEQYSLEEVQSFLIKAVVYLLPVSIGLIFSKRLLTGKW